jgi:hypothetical protein
MATKTPMSQGLQLRGLTCDLWHQIYQPNAMEDAATVAGRLMEEEVLECIELDCN